jgi:hypothetical protein
MDFEEYIEKGKWPIPARFLSDCLRQMRYNAADAKYENDYPGIFKYLQSEFEKLGKSDADLLSDFLSGRITLNEKKVVERAIGDKPSSSSYALLDFICHVRTKYSKSLAQIIWTEYKDESKPKYAVTIPEYAKEEIESLISGRPYTRKITTPKDKENDNTKEQTPKERKKSKGLFTKRVFLAFASNKWLFFILVASMIASGILYVASQSMWIEIDYDVQRNPALFYFRNLSSARLTNINFKIQNDILDSVTFLDHPTLTMPVPASQRETVFNIDPDSKNTVNLLFPEMPSYFQFSSVLPYIGKFDTPHILPTDDQDNIIPQARLQKKGSITYIIGNRSYVYCITAILLTVNVILVLKYLWKK